MLFLNWFSKVSTYWHVKIKAEFFKFRKMGFKDHYDLKQESIFLVGPHTYWLLIEIWRLKYISEFKNPKVINVIHFTLNRFPFDLIIYMYMYIHLNLQWDLHSRFIYFFQVNIKLILKAYKNLKPFLLSKHGLHGSNTQTKKSKLF